MYLVTIGLLYTFYVNAAFSLKFYKHKGTVVIDAYIKGIGTTFEPYIICILLNSLVYNYEEHP